MGGLTRDESVEQLRAAREMTCKIQELHHSKRMETIRLEHKQQLAVMKLKRMEEMDALKAERAEKRKEFEARELAYHTSVAARLEESQEALRALKSERQGLYENAKAAERLTRRTNCAQKEEPLLIEEIP